MSSYDEEQELYRRGKLAGEPAFKPPPPDVCKWRWDKRVGICETSCSGKKAFPYAFESPSYMFKFCPYCGKPLVEVKE